MSEPFELRKWVWDERDFDLMCWDECRVHALAFDAEAEEFLLDIDYIHMSHITGDESDFTYWISPATLVFEGANSVETGLQSYGDGLVIATIWRAQKHPSHQALPLGSVPWRWRIECEQGNIDLWAKGLKQFIRCSPLLSNSPALDLKQRGLSFERRHTD